MRNVFGTFPKPFIPSDASGLLFWGKYNTGLFQDSAKTTPATGTDPVGAWADSSGSGNDELQATAAKRPVLSAGSLSFDGTDDFLQCAASLTLKPVTFFCLCKPVALSAYQRLISGATGLFCVDIEITTGNLRLLKNNTALIGTSTIAVGTSSFNRVVVTYDGSGNYAFYVNGSSAGSGTNDQALSAGPPSIGDASDTVHFNGLMKEWGFYNAVLSAGEISNLNSYLGTI